MAALLWCGCDGCFALQEARIKLTGCLDSSWPVGQSLSARNGMLLT